MASGIDSIFALHGQALQLHSKRLELITANLANADTPGFKAQDIDFRKALAGATESVSMATSAPGHMHAGGADAPGAEVQFRQASQPSLDGNTVDTNMEKTMMAEATVRYESTLMFLNRKINGLRSALRE